MMIPRTRIVTERTAVPWRRATVPVPNVASAVTGCHHRADSITMPIRACVNVRCRFCTGPRRHPALCPCRPPPPTTDHDDHGVPMTRSTFAASVKHPVRPDTGRPVANVSCRIVRLIRPRIRWLRVPKGRTRYLGNPCKQREGSTISRGKLTFIQVIMCII